MSRTDPRPSRRRRRLLVPVLLLGAGAWVVVARRSAEQTDDVWVSRPPVEQAVVPPVPRALSSVSTSASVERCGPHGPGSASPLPDGSAPGPEFTIKGNGGSGLFHPPSSPYYRRTRAEVWFCTAEDAIAAGFTPYRPRRTSAAAPPEG